jgi:hypothetical protein
LKEGLERSRAAITAETAEIGRIEEALAALPALKERLKRFAAAGLDEKLKDKTLIDKEGRFFEQATEMTEQARKLAAYVLDQATSEGPLVGDEAKELPNSTIVAKLDAVQSKLLQKIKAAGQSIEAAVTEATTGVVKIKAEWAPKQKAAEELYQKTLKQLKAEGHDAAKERSRSRQCPAERFARSNGVRHSQALLRQLQPSVGATEEHGKFDFD